MTALVVVNTVAANIMTAWVVSVGLLITFRMLLPGVEPLFPRFVFHELRPLYLPCVVVLFVTGSVGADVRPAWARIGALLFLVAVWFLCKDVDTDDRWKRRRRRVADKVSRVGGRLTVVPATSGGPS